ncbi:MAG: 16S rRNA (cytosine(1402)-N(4))-methyltransferase RsmH [Alphaproteobacteria bacterium]|nr:MAG: 16S rRNA (cytosine(1402)-N(4))-methyltransferase RsmH [Alphaproteobacteria bacterium]
MTRDTHTPVLIAEVLKVLSPTDGETYVDATFGRGGYTRAILNAANCRVIALDCDEAAVPHATALKASYAQRFDFVRARFGQIHKHLTALPHAGQGVDGIVADFGVSSPQLDEADRGFSFFHEGPLDMRMDRTELHTAAHAVNTYPEEELIRIFRHYGEEPRARAIARAIVADRTETPFTTTKQLASLVARVARYGHKKTHPATRVFQALRIEVNQELDEIDRLLDQSLMSLRANGRLICVSFHSLEDRRVKQFMKMHTQPRTHTNKYKNTVTHNNDLAHYAFDLITHKSITASQDELANNPRARSAKLRAARRLLSSSSQGGVLA